MKEHTIPSSIRTPLSSTSENVPINTSLSKVYEQTDNIFKTPVPVSKTKEVYSQCPECQSPARTTFKKAGYCKRCNHDFCIHCFYLKNTHSPTCQVVGGPGVTCSPRKATNSNRRQSVGSKESKSRLKRLWWCLSIQDKEENKERSNSRFLSTTHSDMIVHEVSQILANWIETVLCRQSNIYFT